MKSCDVFKQPGYLRLGCEFLEDVEAVVVVVADREGAVEHGFSDWHCGVADFAAGEFEVEEWEAVKGHLVVGCVVVGGADEVVGALVVGVCCCDFVALVVVVVDSL